MQGVIQNRNAMPTASIKNLLPIRPYFEVIIHTKKAVENSP